ncbi:hypothetical protein Aduo_012600 [Ancylostoma duodenale]
MYNTRSRDSHQSTIESNAMTNGTGRGHPVAEDRPTAEVPDSTSRYQPWTPSIPADENKSVLAALRVWQPHAFGGLRSSLLFWACEPSFYTLDANEDLQWLQHFFFMTDDSNSFNNGFLRVFPDSLAKKLLCVFMWFSCSGQGKKRQLKSLLSDCGCQAPPPTPAPTPSSSASSSHARPPQPQSKGPVYVERGKCKFACGSTTRHYGTECDVYATISDRRDRMYELHLCLRSFQQHLLLNAEADCKPVPCYYCSQDNREMSNHVSALCPFLFPH